jgi:hypothetical protein
MEKGFILGEQRISKQRNCGEKKYYFKNICRKIGNSKTINRRKRNCVANAVFLRHLCKKQMFSAFAEVGKNG